MICLSNCILNWNIKMAVDFWNHATAYKQSGERIQMSNICAYCECVYVQAGTCGIPRFFQRQSMTIDELRPLLCDYRLSSIGQCQLTNKAWIVIDWSIDFPIIGFIDWFKAKLEELQVYLRHLPRCFAIFVSTDSERNSICNWFSTKIEI